MPLVAIIGLALLEAPRVVLHDLGVIHEGTVVNALFVFLPPVVWIVVALVSRVPNPFVTILAIGVCYGVFLALGHQLMWGITFADNPPRLGGNLAGLDPTIQVVVLRSFAVLSSLVTGVIVGVIAGFVAWGFSAVTRSSERPR
ncbi:hypothetical protein GCM10028820_08710 [Tessaracoccus terricola]